MTDHRNPLPVAVAVVPVHGGGLVAIRRAIPPVGLALPGGYIELGERWQDAAARELREETGVVVDADAIRDVRVLSAPDGTLLVFGRTAPVARAALEGFAPSDEVSAVEVIEAPRDDVVFPLHGQVVAEHFAASGA